MAKVMISLPEDLLELLDEAAAREEKSRSRFIREAVRERIARGALDDRREALEAIRRRFRDVPPSEVKPEDFIRAERDRRHGPA